MASLSEVVVNHATLDDGLISRNIHIEFLLFQFYDSHLEVPLISILQLNTTKNLSIYIRTIKAS